MELFQFQLFFKTMLTLTSELAGSAKKWYKKRKKTKKTKKVKKRVQLKPDHTCPSGSSSFQVSDKSPSVPSSEVQGNLPVPNTNGSVTEIHKDVLKVSVPESKLLSGFELVKVIGEGGYGKVFLAKQASNNQFWAIKALSKDFVLKSDIVDGTFMEKRVLTLGSSFPYLPTLHSTFTSPSHLFYAMEYLSGGDVFFHLSQTSVFDLDRVRFYAAELLAALQFLHKHGIIYREVANLWQKKDLTSANVLLDCDGHCVLADFGLCCENTSPDGVPTEQVIYGTTDYMAPEVVKREKYSFAGDWWSLGVLCYEMIFGLLPFYGRDESDLMLSIVSSPVDIPPDTDMRTKTFLTALLTKDPKERLGCIENVQPIRKHPFFWEIDWKKIDRKELVPPFKPQVSHSADSSNFGTEFTGQPAKLATIDPTLIESINQEVFDGFASTSTSSTSQVSSGDCHHNHYPLPQRSLSLTHF